MQQILGQVAGVRVGRVVTQPWGGAGVPSAAIKQEVAGRSAVGRLGLPGDEHGDTVNHGGPEKAVLVFPRHRYDDWRSAGLDLPEGGFFENLTLDLPGTDETVVVLGETWRIGGAVVQVSQPRNPCFKLARRWGIDDLVVRVQDTGWAGWYLRVLEPGEIGVGDTVELLERPEGAPTVGEVARVLNRDKRDLEGARRLLDAPGMPERWVAKLRRRLGGTVDEESARTTGPTDA